MRYRSIAYELLIMFTRFLCILGMSMPILSCATHQTEKVLSDYPTRKQFLYASIHMGSRCSILLFAQSEQAGALAAKAAFDEIALIEQCLSDYRPNSEVMQLVSQPSGQWIEVSPTLMDVLDQSEQFYALSDGAFDPTIGKLTHLWRNAKQSGGIPSEQEINDALDCVGFNLLDFDQEQSKVRCLKSGMILDFGAIGKGYAADRALNVLKEHGIDHALVDLGGDLAIGDAPSDQSEGWEVSVQPGNSAHWSSRIHSKGVATSGDLERHYEHDGVRYSHIIDPRTGMGITHPRAVTVIAQDATTADAIASIVSVLGESIISELEVEYPGIIIRIAQGEPYSQN